MFDAVTSHQIVPFGTELMKVFDCKTAEAVVTATRTPDGIWTVRADGVPDVTAPDREAAVMAMTEQTTAALPGTGYSTTVPHGLFGLS